MNTYFCVLMIIPNSFCWLEDIKAEDIDLYNEESMQSVATLMSYRTEKFLYASPSVKNDNNK